MRESATDVGVAVVGAGSAWQSVQSTLRALIWSIARHARLVRTFRLDLATRTKGRRLPPVPFFSPWKRALSHRPVPDTHRREPTSVSKP